MFIAIIEDEDRQWVYEGEVQGNPIWVIQKNAKPKLLTEKEALKIARRDSGSGEIARAERA